MPSQELMERVRTLRGQGRSPKEIARALRLSPATVTPLVRAIAAAEARGAREPVIVGCWVSPGWADGLTVHGQPEWPGIDEPGDPGKSGLVTVLVAHERGGSKVSACGYLIDVYCLGVKDVFGPHALDRRKLPEFVHQYFCSYDAPPVAAPAELARHLVFGAVAYARDLGFEPAPGFEAAAGHLGHWEGLSAIGFGRGGKPLFVQGPYDNAAGVMKTLERSTGHGNFDFLVVA
jgi:hypothetical protein